MKLKASAIMAAVAVAALLGLPGVGAADTTPSPSESGAGTVVASTGDEARVQPYVQPSIVFVKVTYEAYLSDRRYQDSPFFDGSGFTLTSSCTGYVVNPEGWIATAGHCVSYKEARKDYVNYATAWALKNQFYNGSGPNFIHGVVNKYLKMEPTKGDGPRNQPFREANVYWGANVSGLQAEDGKPARIVDWQELEEGDAALLKVDETNMNSLLLVPGDSTVDTLTQVAAIGFPGTVNEVTDSNYNPSIKTGTVSSQKTIGNGLIPVYEISADVSPGMSGGPTVNYQGQVIGTNSFFPSDENQSFNFVGTSQRVLELMNSQGIPNEQSADTQTYREGIDAYFNGDKATAVSDLSAVKEAQPANDMVQTYLQRAEDLPEPASDDGGFPWWILLILLALLVAVAVIAVVVLTQRNRRAEVVPATGTATTLPDQETAPTGDTESIPVVGKYCGNCGSHVAAGNRYCNVCGAQVL